MDIYKVLPANFYASSVPYFDCEQSVWLCKKDRKHALRIENVSFDGVVLRRVLDYLASLFEICYELKGCNIHIGRKQAEGSLSSSSVWNEYWWANVLWALVSLLDVEHFGESRRAVTNWRLEKQM